MRYDGFAILPGYDPEKSQSSLAWHETLPRKRIQPSDWTSRRMGAAIPAPVALHIGTFAQHLFLEMARAIR
jgi:hypothetical protein